MRAVVQRVSRAEVRVEGRATGRIGRGLAVLVGVARDDRDADARLLADKVAALRVFEDAGGKMNLGSGVLYGSINKMLESGFIEESGDRPDRSSSKDPAGSSKRIVYWTGATFSMRSSSAIVLSRSR